MNFEYWEAVAKKNGVHGLYVYYTSQANELKPDVDITYKNKKRSVVLSKRPRSAKRKWNLVSLHPRESNSTQGLYIGISKTNFLKHFHNSNKEMLPVDFEGKPTEIQKGNEWFFIYWKNEQEIQKIFDWIKQVP